MAFFAFKLFESESKSELLGAKSDYKFKSFRIRVEFGFESKSELKHYEWKDG